MASVIELPYPFVSSLCTCSDLSYHRYVIVHPYIPSLNLSESLPATWSTCSLFRCSSVADSLLCEHLRDVLLQGGSPHEQQYLTAIQQFTSILPPPLLLLLQPPLEHLPQSMSQCRDKVLVTFLFQQCLKPAGVLSLLQTDSVYLAHQKFLQLPIQLSSFPPLILSHNMTGSLSK